MAMTYKQMMAAGTADDEILLDLVSAWHDAPEDGQPLHEFLGFDSLEEYDGETRLKYLSFDEGGECGASSTRAGQG